MQTFLDTVVRFLHQGLDAIFNFVAMIWTWSAGQIGALTKVPWHDWPLWKEMLLFVIAAGVIYALYNVAMELWVAGEKILTGFAALLLVMVRTLPSIVLAGLIALGGIWVLNNVDLSSFQVSGLVSPK